MPATESLEYIYGEGIHHLTPHMIGFICSMVDLETNYYNLPEDQYNYVTWFQEMYHLRNTDPDQYKLRLNNAYEKAYQNYYRNFPDQGSIRRAMTFILNAETYPNYHTERKGAVPEIVSGVPTGPGFFRRMFTRYLDYLEQQTNLSSPD